MQQNLSEVWTGKPVHQKHHSKISVHSGQTSHYPRSLLTYLAPGHSSLTFNVFICYHCYTLTCPAFHTQWRFRRNLSRTLGTVHTYCVWFLSSFSTCQKCYFLHRWLISCVNIARAFFLHMSALVSICVHLYRYNTL